VVSRAVMDLGNVVGETVPVSMSDCKLLHATTLEEYATLSVTAETVAAAESIAKVGAGAAAAASCASPFAGGICG
jgi:hypothetical protein